ncbi:MAG TPA: thiol:disulfide interchange protein DsbA/DsbL [Ignavibacteriaceae bacterium]
MQRRHFIQAIAALSVTPMAFAQASRPPYTELATPFPRYKRGEIGIVEFFSFGCPHCADFYPTIHNWEATLGKDVTFKKMPVAFGRAAWVILGKVYLSLEDMGESSRLEGDIFKAIHQDKIDLMNEQTLIKWLGDRKVNTEKFKSLFKSFDIDTKLKQNDKFAKDTDIHGVPSMLVDGKYLIEGVGKEEMIKTANALIEKIRKEKK